MINSYQRALNQPGTDAIVVFSGVAQLPWLRWLRPGYRHCFAAVRGHSGWITLEALSTGTVISQIPDRDPVDLAEAYHAIGCRTVITTCHPLQKTPLPWAPFTCVEAVKRMLGLRAPMVVTPYQLWRCLR